MGRLAIRSATAALAIALIAASPTPWTPNSAHAADESPLADAPPRMHGIKLHEGRNFLTAQFGSTLGDDYTTNLMAGLSWRYYLSHWIGIGVDVWAGGGVDTSLTDQINSQLSTDAQPFELSTSSLRLLANVAVELVPFEGKAMFFGDELVRMDVHITLGAGVALTSGTNRIEDETAVAPMFGVGIRLFPNDWLSVGIDLRDYLVNRVLASRKDGSVPGASFDHNWLLGLSVGFSFPTEPEFDR